MPDDRKIAVIGAPNFVTAGYTTAEAGAGVPLPAGFEAINLLTDEPSDRCRVPVLTRANARFSFYFPGFESRTIGAFGLINVNLSRFGSYRLIGSDETGSVPETHHEILAPSSQLAGTNITGGVTNVDEGAHAPDGLWVTPTSTATGGAWDVRYAFPTPAATPVQGSNLQAFEIWVRLAGTLTDINTRPLIRVSLGESGAQKGILGTRAVTETSGQLLIFPWNAASLTTASGADVEIKIEHSGGVGLGGSFVELGAVDWHCESGTFDHDSGWLPSPFSGQAATWGGSYADESGPEPMRNLAYLPDGYWDNIVQWQWCFSDDQTFNGTLEAGLPLWPTNWPLSALRSPAGYAEAGVGVAGPAFIPSLLNFAKGPLVSVRDASTSGLTLGGQEYGSRRRPRRVEPVRLPQLTESEGYAIFDRLDWRKGKKLPVLLVKYPDAAADARRYTSIWATLEEMPGLELPPAHGRQSWSGIFIEKL